MQTKLAVLEVLKTRGLTKYALAKRLGCHPVSINQWLANTRMSADYANKFERLFGVEIDDCYDTRPAPANNGRASAVRTS